MPTYAWTGKDSSGKSKKGSMTAQNSDEVALVLKGQKVTPETIKETKAGFKLKIPGMGGGVDTQTLVVFTRQFVTMIEAGLPIVQTMDILAAQQKKGSGFEKAISKVKSDIEQGSTLADALRGHPAIFEPLYCNLVEAGEAGGVLDTVLNKLAVYLEKQAKMIKQIKGALTYPVITLGIAVGAVVIMLLKVIPTFEKIFKDMGAELPGLTQKVVNMSHALQESYGRLAAEAVGFVVFFMTIKQFEKVAYFIDMIVLKLPLFGELIRKSAVARFTSTLGTLLSSGVPITDALDIGASVVGNRLIKIEVEKAKAAITEGKTFTEPLKQSTIFPSMVVQMIEIGEQTGQLDSMLEKVSGFFEEEVDASVEALSAAIEPLMMVLVGGIVATMLGAMYLPIFSIAGAVKK